MARHQPTPEQRSNVTVLCGLGATVEMIAGLLNIEPDTLPLRDFTMTDDVYMGAPEVRRGYRMTPPTLRRWVRLGPCAGRLGRETVRFAGAGPVRRTGR